MRKIKFLYYRFKLYLLYLSYEDRLDRKTKKLFHKRTKLFLKRDPKEEILNKKILDLGFTIVDKRSKTSYKGNLIQYTINHSKYEVR